MKTIIVPMLNITSKDQLPLEFQVNQTNGLMNCIYSLININLTSFTEIIFGILKEHEDKYSIVDHIKADIKRNDIKDLFNALEISYYIFDKPTSSQSETIYTIINEFDLIDNLFIKDADNLCKVTQQIPDKNGICVYSLEDTKFVDTINKSYVSLDDHNIITNTIEKKVISPLFNCGGYMFENAKDFIDAYDNLKQYDNEDNGHIRLSHIIYWLIINKKKTFIPIEAEEYIDFELEKY